MIGTNAYGTYYGTNASEAYYWTVADVEAWARRWADGTGPVFSNQKIYKAGEYKAALFLWRHLSAAQQRSLLLNGTFEVVGSATGSVYTFMLRPGDYARIRGTVQTDFRRGHQSQLEYCYCCRAYDVPYADELLANKLYLETDERHWLAIAH